MEESYAFELKKAEEFKDNMINFIECVKQDAPLQVFYLDKILDYIDDVYDVDYRYWGLKSEDKDKLKAEIIKHLTED